MCGHERNLVLFCVPRAIRALTLKENKDKNKRFQIFTLLPAMIPAIIIRERRTSLWQLAPWEPTATGEL